jgi:DNA-binding transcriptional LysR family regulator
VDLEELRALLAVAETGSVLAASDRLKIPRATVRRRLDTLEARVGAPLVHRGPSGALLTEAGRSVATHARAILD